MLVKMSFYPPSRKNGYLIYQGGEGGRRELGCRHGEPLMFAGIKATMGWNSL